MNVIGLLAILASIAMFGFTHRMLHQKSLVVRFVIFGTMVILSVPAALSTLHYFHVMPEMAWFYNMRSWLGSEFLVVFLGAAGGAGATLLPRSLLILPLLGSIVLAIVPHLKPLMNPLILSSTTEKWDGHGCLQSTASTCGPACTATILKYIGLRSSEHEISRAAYTSSSGTEAWYLARYIRSRGLGVRFDFRPSFSTSAGFPAVIGVRVGGFGHFIAVLDVSGNELTCWDPLNGMVRLPTAEFLRHYDFTGFHMVVSSR